MRVRAIAVGGALLLLTGCGAADMTKQASPFANAQGAKTVTLSVQSWVGAQANVAVAQYLLEHELGYRVDTVQVDEVPAWDALSQGRLDAIEVHQPDAPHASSREVKRQRRSEPTGADEHHARRFQLALPIGSDFRDYQVSPVTPQLGGVERRQLGRDVERAHASLASATSTDSSASASLAVSRRNARGSRHAPRATGTIR